MFDLGLGSKWKTSEHEARVLDTRILCMDSTCRIAPREHTYMYVCMCIYIYIFFCVSKTPSGPGSRHFRGFAITLIHTELGSTPLDE
jgi:hypothetical protein